MQPLEEKDWQTGRRVFVPQQLRGSWHAFGLLGRDDSGTWRLCDPNNPARIFPLDLRNRTLYEIPDAVTWEGIATGCAVNVGSVTMAEVLARRPDLLDRVDLRLPDVASELADDLVADWAACLDRALLRQYGPTPLARDPAATA